MIYYIVACINSLSISVAQCYPILWIYYLSVHTCTDDGHLSNFQLLVVINSAAVNLCAQIQCAFATVG
jgi:hypothetical protein